MGLTRPHGFLPRTSAETLAMLSCQPVDPQIAYYAGLTRHPSRLVDLAMMGVDVDSRGEVLVRSSIASSTPGKQRALETHN